MEINITGMSMQEILPLSRSNSTTNVKLFSLNGLRAMDLKLNKITELL